MTFSNEDIKGLLESETLLLELQKLSHVEIGQKHKSLIRKANGSLGLGDPEFKPWFQSWIAEKSIPLFSTVASFTQPSHIANKKITQIISKWISRIDPKHILEFGSGIGNLTFPALASSKGRVTATDVNETALSALDKSLLNAGLSDRVSIQCGDFRMKKLDVTEPFDVLLLNPARNGVGQFLEPLLPLKPKFIIYMSCYLESFKADTKNLNDYKLKEIHIVDQFPNTKHMEILSLWERYSQL